MNKTKISQKQSEFFCKTTRETPKDVEYDSHAYLIRGGYIRESVAGRYYFLPLGYKVQQKIMEVVREEMNNAGAQEMLAPILHPLELWKETNRTNTTGFELMKVTDRRGGEFALGGTAEEMFVDLVRQFKLSYKDLPFQLYQFSPKFRDELRARGGLLRVREFIMKDGYSFHRNEEDFKETYEKMKKAYTKMFSRLGLKTAIVESDNGYIGGEYCHEFIVESEIGESKYFTTENGDYSAHEDVAKFMKFKEENTNEPEKAREDVEGVGIIGVEELAKFLQIPAEKTTKTILFVTEKGEVVAVAINGIYDINETKLKNILGCAQLKLASPEVVEKITGATVGYAGILNLPKEVRVVMDESLKGRKNFECGANKTNYHSINLNFGRDIIEPEKYYDIALAKAGYLALDGKQPLVEKKGIEVGNIFQLGYHYSKLMKGAVYTDADGKEKPFYMGCYGFGVGRTMATIAEKYHDVKGLMWPSIVAPFDVHVVSLKDNDYAVKVVEMLNAEGLEVLFDERDGASVGEKFADSELIGIPVQVIVSERGAKENIVEIRERKDLKNSQKINRDLGLILAEINKILKYND
jgi:prolyl-tRNA synthetase